MKISVLLYFGYLFLVSNVYARANETNLPDILQRIKPSVVAVGTFMPSRSPAALFLGTGFVIGNGQQVITNHHVITKELDSAHLEKLAIFYFQDQQQRMQLVEITASDEQHDLVLLSFQEGKLPALELGNSSRVREGELYAFTGYPIGVVLGLHPVTHRGIISAITPNVIPAISDKQLNGKMLKKLDTPYDVFQLDATAYPGNSGSPLYEIETGKVIGILNKVFVQDSKENLLSSPSGISYAIPAEHISLLLLQKSIMLLK